MIFSKIVTQIGKKLPTQKIGKGLTGVVDDLKSQINSDASKISTPDLLADLANKARPRTRISELIPKDTASHDHNSTRSSSEDTAKGKVNSEEVQKNTEEIEHTNKDHTDNLNKTDSENTSEGYDDLAHQTIEQENTKKIEIDDLQHKQTKDLNEQKIDGNTQTNHKDVVDPNKNNLDTDPHNLKKAEIKADTIDSVNNKKPNNHNTETPVDPNKAAAEIDPKSDILTHGETIRTGTGSSSQAIFIFLGIILGGIAWMREYCIDLFLFSKNAAMQIIAYVIAPFAILGLVFFGMNTISMFIINLIGTYVIRNPLVNILALISRLVSSVLVSVFSRNRSYPIKTIEGQLLNHVKSNHKTASIYQKLIQKVSALLYFENITFYTIALPVQFTVLHDIMDNVYKFISEFLKTEVNEDAIHEEKDKTRTLNNLNNNKVIELILFGLSYTQNIARRYIKFLAHTSETQIDGIIVKINNKIHTFIAPYLTKNVIENN